MGTNNEYKYGQRYDTDHCDASGFDWQGELTDNCIIEGNIYLSFVNSEYYCKNSKIS